MKVYDLSCDNGHSFEGWFADEADYLQQQETALLSCPLCNSHTIHKLLSAPRLNLRGDSMASKAENQNAPLHEPANLTPFSEQTEATNALNPNARREQAQHWLSEMRSALAKTEDVGESFPEQARLMHQGELEAKPIRGMASMEETVELIKEGVPILPVPAILKETLQ